MVGPHGVRASHPFPRNIIVAFLKTIPICRGITASRHSLVSPPFFFSGVNTMEWFEATSLCFLLCLFPFLTQCCGTPCPGHCPPTSLYHMYDGVSSWSNAWTQHRMFCRCGSLFARERNVFTPLLSATQVASLRSLRGEVGECSVRRLHQTYLFVTLVVARPLPSKRFEPSRHPRPRKRLVVSSARFKANLPCFCSTPPP